MKKNDTPYLIGLFEDNSEHGKLFLEKKRYHLYSDPENTAYYSPCNNDGGKKNIIFHLKNRKEITIDGSGAELICHGRVTPFIIDGCENITITNLTIDYSRPFYTQATVMESDEKGSVLKIDKIKFPHRFNNNRWIMMDETWENDITGFPCLLQAFDPITKAPARHSLTFFGIFGEKNVILDELPAPVAQFSLNILYETEYESVIRISSNQMPGDYRFKKGNELIICHEPRNDYGFFINESKNIAIENVKINACGSMGIIAQLTEDITIRNLDISLDESSKGLVTTLADATHFVHCSGTVVIENCRLENMMDDAVNIHGIYTVCKMESDTDLTAKLMHAEQQGFNPYLKGDELLLLDTAGREVTHSARIKNSRFKNPEKTEIFIELESPFEGHSGREYLGENRKRMPNAILCGNRTGNNRPRGFLITTPGKVIVKENIFFNSHFAIHISSDSVYWYESGSVQDFTICDNIFKDCCYMNDGPAIMISAEFSDKIGENIWGHCNINIHDNIFETFQTELVFASRVQGINLENNTYLKTDKYPLLKQGKAIELDRCVISGRADAPKFS